MRSLMQRFIALFFVLAFILPAYPAADDISRLYNFTSGTTIQSSQVNGELNQLITTMNNKFGRGADNTLSGNNTFSGTSTFSGTGTFSNASVGLKTDKLSEYTVGNGTLLNSVLLKNGFIQLTPTTQPYVPATNGEFGIDTTNNLYMGRIGGTNVPFATDNGVNAQTGTSYTVLTSDRNKAVTLSNASAIAVTLPQAGSTGFASNWKATFVNLGTGTVTITPTTSTIDGASTITLAQNQGIQVFSDGTNYETNRGKSSTPGLVLLAVGTASNSATVDFTSNINSTYDEYEIRYTGVIPATAADMWVRISEDGGSTWKAGASDYIYNIQYNNTGSTLGNQGSTSDTKMSIVRSLTTAAGASAYGILRFAVPTSTTLKKPFCMESVNIGNAEHGSGSGWYQTDNGAINGVRFLMSTGNISSGIFRLYAVQKNGMDWIIIVALLYRRPRRRPKKQDQKQEILKYAA